MPSRLDRVAERLSRDPRSRFLLEKIAASQNEPSPARQVSVPAAVEGPEAALALRSPSPGPSGLPVPAALLHWTDESIAQLGAFMAEHGISDPELAMVEFEKQHPPPEPVAGSRTNWNFFGRRDNGADNAAYEMLLHGDYEGFLRKSIPAALAEVRGQR
jgi:hypothetical protein